MMYGQIILVESALQNGKNDKGEALSLLTDLQKIYLWIGISTLFGLLFIFLKRSFDNKKKRRAQDEKSADL
jgi:lipoprotein signal peptidase